MAKEKNAALSDFFKQMLQPGIYKRSQGKVARQVTFAGLAVAVLLAAWRMNVFGKNVTGDYGHLWQFAVPGVIALVGMWVAFRLVNLPAFADFLIAVEAEMNKVSWPSRGELVRSSIVVIVLIVFMAMVLFGYDVFWRYLLGFLRVVQTR